MKKNIKRERKKVKLTFWGIINLSCFVIIVFCCGFLLALAITHNFPTISALNPFSSQKSMLRVENVTNSSCYGLDLVNTSWCLNKEVQTFYKYNLSNIGKAITDEQLKAEGGVCSNWANFYSKHLKSLNSTFNVETPILRVNQTDNHIVVLVSDESGYCLIDQTLIGCVYFKNSGEVNETR